jgi:hypothetical protein
MNKLLYPIEAFCESKLFNGCPECVNTISSLYFCVVAYIGFTHTKKYHYMFECFIFYVYLFVLGLTSALYHGTCVISGKLLDESTMLLITCIMILYVIDVSNYNKENKFIIGVVITSYYVLVLIINSIIVNIILFSLLFISPILLLIIIKYDMFVIIGDNDDKMAIRVLNNSVYTLIISCLFWLVTEALCDQWIYIGLLFGHMFWHIGMAYTTHHIFQYVYYVKLRRLHLHPKWKLMYGLYVIT